MALATMTGKNGRLVVHMYTNWKRLQMNFKEADGWNGLVQPISGLLEEDRVLGVDKTHNQSYDLIILIK